MDFFGVPEDQRKNVPYCLSTVIHNYSCPFNNRIYLEHMNING
jgi:hypothetical protein